MRSNRRQLGLFTPGSDACETALLQLREAHDNPICAIAPLTPRRASIAPQLALCLEPIIKVVTVLASSRFE